MQTSMNMQPVIVSDDPLSFFLLNDTSNDGSKDDECDLLAEELLNAVITEVAEATSCNSVGSTATTEADKVLDPVEAVYDVVSVTEEEERIGVLAPGVEDTPRTAISTRHTTHPLDPAASTSTTTTNTRKTASGTTTTTSSTTTSTFFNRGLESLKMAAASSSGVSSLLQKAASNLMSSSNASSQPSNISAAAYNSTDKSVSPVEDSHQHTDATTTATTNGSVGRATIATLVPSDHDTHNTNMMIQQQQQQLLSDPTIQAKLVTFAVGPLLQGERIIMFLPNVVNVASTDTAVTGLSSSASYTSTTKHSSSSLWAVCMTFYRFLLINYTMEGLEYLAKAPGSVVVNSSKEKTPENNIDESGFVVKRAAKVVHGLDNAISRAGLTRQWQYHHATMAASARIHKKHVMQIPLSSIDRVEKGDLVYAGSNTSSTSVTMGGQQQQTVVLYDKNGRWMRFSATNLGDAIRAHEALSTYAFPGKRNLGYLFAFESCREEVLEAAAAISSTSTIQHSTNTPKRTNNARYDPIKEFSRMGILPNKQQEMQQQNLPWSMTMINSNYSICSSYPSILVVPHVASEEKVGERGARLIRQTASFRSEGRLPVLSWGCGHDAASLWRCSQPKVGLGSNRSASDEFFIKSIAETAGRYVKANTMTLPPAYTRLLTGATDSESDMLTFLHVVSSPTANSGGLPSAHQPTMPIPTLRILDLRPKASAMANRTQGYGYESTANYPNCQLSFYNIANIHGVRDSYQRLNNLALSPTNTQDVQFSSMVESTGWLQMIRCILNASWQAAAIVNFHRLPVIVHCSHGWDRTSQVSALAQLMLDPFYRTMDGFAILVEKEFCAFGHPFHMRSGHGETSAGDYSSVSSSQRAPVFLQFLDCVWQLTNIFPSFFEFNGRYLLAISDHIYSCRFGTLLCDNERERVAAGVYERTNSLWDYLDEHRTMFLNQRFNRVSKLLIPPLPCILRRVSLWSDYHLRYSPRAYLACLPNELVPFVHYRSICTREQQEQDGSGNYPEEFSSLLCASDESDALLHQTLLELEECRSKCKAQDNEIVRLRQALAQMTSGNLTTSE